MRICATSDLHGWLPEIPECDILLIAGDIVPDGFTPRVKIPMDPMEQQRWLLNEFYEWLLAVPAKHIVGIGGNHDWPFVKSDIAEQLPWTYLNNSSTEIAGIKVHGSPMSCAFGNWAFMLPDEHLAPYWNDIPEDTHILMVHGPAYGFGDKTDEQYGGLHVGSKTLRAKLDNGHFPNLKLVVTGHIHPDFGQWDHKRRYANVSHVNPQYLPTNQPMVWEWRELV